MIPKQKVVNFVDKHQAKMGELELSFFEMTTAMAFDYFDQSDVEVAVIETGLGGRLDATNIITPLVSVVTNVGLEHTEYLGDTLRKIGCHGKKGQNNIRERRYRPMRGGYFVRLRSNSHSQKRISAQRPKPRGTDFFPSDARTPQNNVQKLPFALPAPTYANLSLKYCHSANYGRAE